MTIYTYKHAHIPKASTPWKPENCHESQCQLCHCQTQHQRGYQQWQWWHYWQFLVLSVPITKSWRWLCNISAVWPWSICRQYEDQTGLPSGNTLNIPPTLIHCLRHIHHQHLSLIIWYFQLQTCHLTSIGIHIDTLRLRQDGWHFPDNIFKCMFLNENVQILIRVSLKFVPRGPINNISALVQIMAWHRIGDKPLLEPMVT